MHTLIPVVGIGRVRKLRDYVLRAGESVQPRHLVEIGIETANGRDASLAACQGDDRSVEAQSTR